MPFGDDFFGHRTFATRPDERPNQAAWLSLLPVALPYAILIVSLALTRVVPMLNGSLRAAEIRPFEGVPAWFPLLHPGTWLLLVALLTVLALRQGGALPRLATAAWQQGWKSVTTIGAFLVMAQIMAESGTAQSLAQGVALALGAAALLATPVLAGAFGFVTGSGNATNALLMTSQIGLAVQYGLPPLWIASVQNIAASALTMLSPVRVSMGCALVGDRRLEGQAYARAWVLGVVPVLFLILICGGLLVQP